MRIPAWKHGVRFAVAFLWVAVLTTWCFQIYAFFAFHESTFYGALCAAAVLEGLRWLWWIALLPSLAFGTVWYGSSYGSWRRTFGGHPARRSLERVEIVGAACLGICLWVFVWRLVSIVVYWGSGIPVAKPIQQVLYGEFYGPAESEVLPILVAVGALGAGVMFLKSWNAFTRAGVNRSLLVLFSLSSLAFGMFFPSIAWPLTLASAVPQQLHQLPHVSREYPLLAGREDPDGLERLLRKYLWTHHPPTQMVSIRDIDHIRRDPVQACGTCQLPLTILATFTGITVKIADTDATSGAPGSVLEVPLSGDEARVYAGAQVTYARTSPIDDLDGLELQSDWVALKIDAGVEFRTVAGLLRLLREVGVRRVTFAAVPWDYVLPSGEVPRLVLDPGMGTATYHPAKAVRLGRGTVVVVRRYVPPTGDTARRCFGQDRFDLRDGVHDWQIPEPNTLPEDVAIVAADDFQDFISRLDRALAGGASTVHVANEAN